MKDTVVALLEIEDLASMTPQRRAEIVNWLRVQALLLEENRADGMDKGIYRSELHSGHANSFDMVDASESRQTP